MVSNWDGRSTADLEAAFERHGQKDSFVPKIIRCLTKPALIAGASWLLKKYVENSGELRRDNIVEIYRLLPELRDWASKLHLLQSIPFMPIDHTQKESVEAFIRSCISDKNKMVRAWAYNGFAELSRQYPEYKGESELLLKAALNDESPAVRARARNVLMNP